MSSNSKTFAILGLFGIIAAVAMCLRMTKMISIEEHEQELMKVRAEASAKINEAESHYRQAIDEELHRRQMSQLFERATARVTSAYA